MCRYVFRFSVSKWLPLHVILLALPIPSRHRRRPDCFGSLLYAWNNLCCSRPFLRVISDSGGREGCTRDSSWQHGVRQANWQTGSGLCWRQRLDLQSVFCPYSRVVFGVGLQITFTACTSTIVATSCKLSFHWICT